MADRYLSFTGTAPGRFLTRRLGLPRPAALTRHTPGGPGLDGGLLHPTAGTAPLALAPVLARTELVHDHDGPPAGHTPGRPVLDGRLLHPTARTSALDRAPVVARTGLGTDDDGHPAAVVLDATGIRDVDALTDVHAALHPVVRSVTTSGRIV